MTGLVGEPAFVTHAAPPRGALALPERLRSETRVQHDAVERELDWERRVSTIGGYRDLLGRLWGFHAAWEPAAAALLADPGFFEPRRKLRMLGADLNRLGMSSDEIAALPVLRPGVDWRTQAEALGSIYVLEGSTLGGQIIARRVLATLGFGPENGCAYFNAYGPDVGAMWRGTRQRLGHVPVEHHDDVVAAASATFERLREWLAASSG